MSTLLFMLCILACGETDSATSGTDGGTGSDGGSGSDGGTAEVPRTRPVQALITGDAKSSPAEHSRGVEGAVASRVVGIHGPYDGEGAQVDVRWDVDEDVVLVLQSYNDVRWVVRETYPGRIREVVAECTGAVLELDLPDGVPTRCGPESAWSSYVEDWVSPHRMLLEDWLAEQELPALASIHYESDPASFLLQEAEGYTEDPSIPDCDAPAPAVDFEPADTSWVLAACPELAEESWVCAGLSEGDVVLLGVDSGRSCVVRDNPVATSRSGIGANMAWLGTRLYAPGPYGSITEIPFLDASHRRSFTFTNGVVADDGGLLARFDGEHAAGSYWDDACLHRYTSFEQAQCEVASDTEVLPILWSSSSFTLDEELFVDASHSADSVYVRDRGAVGPIEEVTLGGGMAGSTESPWWTETCWSCGAAIRRPWSATI